MIRVTSSLQAKREKYVNRSQQSWQELPPKRAVSRYFRFCLRNLRRVRYTCRLFHLPARRRRERFLFGSCRNYARCLYGMLSPWKRNRVKYAPGPLENSCTNSQARTMIWYRVIYRGSCTVSCASRFRLPPPITLIARPPRNNKSFATIP